MQLAVPPMYIAHDILHFPPLTHEIWSRDCSVIVWLDVPCYCVGWSGLQGEALLHVMIS
jgi:hypothetical protein